MKITSYFYNWGVSEEDTKPIRIVKSILVYLAMLMSLGGMVWGGLLLFFNLYQASIIPFGYVIISAINMGSFRFFKNLRVAVFTQIAISMFLPFLLQWHLGGFLASGCVMAWSVLALVGSITMLRTHQFYFTIVLYVLLVLISYVFDSEFALHTPAILTPEVSLVLLVVNVMMIVTISIVVLKLKIDNDYKTLQALEVLQQNAEKNLITEREIRDKLAVNENRYRKLVEDSMILICTHDLLGNLITINQTGEKALEYNRGELIGRNILTLLPPESERDFQTYLDKIRRDKAYESFMTVITKSGQKRIFLFRNTLMDEPGQMPYVMGSAQDVTEWRKSEFRETKIKSDLQLIVSSMDDFVIEFDEYGRFKNFWCRDETKLSRPITYYLGKTIQEAFAFTSEFAQKAQQIYDKVLLSGKPYVAEIDKGWISAKMSYQIRLNPIVENDGSVKRCTVLVSDITLRKQAENELKESYRTQKLLLENLEGAVIIEDANRKIRLVNDEFCQMFGIPLSPDQLKGADCSESAEQTKHLFYNPQNFPARVSEILKGQIKVLGEELELVDGRVLERDYIPIFFNDHYQGHLWHYHDVTRRKQTERALTMAKEEAEESNRLKTIFLGNLSHEVRTPLQGIMGFAEILENPNLPPTKRNEYLGIIKRRTNDMQNIIESLLDLASLETGEIRANPHQIQLIGVLEDVFLRIRNDYSLTGKRIELQLVNNLNDEPLAHVDSQHLQQVIINLMSNAIKFTNLGTVILSIDRNAKCYLISVKDTGIGIPSDMLEHIFQPFRQAHEGISRSKGGIGLGLAICKKMVEMWGGTIEVVSHPGTGSMFSFTIPLMDRDSITFHDNSNSLPMFN
jgi:PAS domain S-box-containing protein